MSNEDSTRRPRMECRPDLPAELEALCAASVEACTRLGEFVDSGGHIATFELDKAATSAAGHLVMNCEISDGFRGCLAAMRAGNGITDTARVPHDDATL